MVVPLGGRRQSPLRGRRTVSGRQRHGRFLMAVVVAFGPAPGYTAANCGTIVLGNRASMLGRLSGMAAT